MTLVGMGLQALARLVRWRSAVRILPVIYHRIGARLLDMRIITEGAFHDHRPLLLVANHVSWLDIVALSSVMPVSFIAKSEVAGWPVVGWMARLQGTVFVKRRSRMSPRQTGSVMQERLRNKDTLVLFAEGTSSAGNRVLPMQSSLLGAAVKEAGTDTGIWVQPVAIRYETWRGLPLSRKDQAHLGWYGDMDLLPHFAGIMRSGGIDVRLMAGQPRRMTPDMDRKQMMRALEEDIRNLRSKVQ